MPLPQPPLPKSPLTTPLSFYSRNTISHEVREEATLRPFSASLDLCDRQPEGGPTAPPAADAWLPPSDRPRATQVLSLSPAGFNSVGVCESLK